LTLEPYEDTILFAFLFYENASSRLGANICTCVGYVYFAIVARLGKLAHFILYLLLLLFSRSSIVFLGAFGCCALLFFFLTFSQIKISSPFVFLFDQNNKQKLLRSGA
jgi:hypothetical protein